MSGSPFIKPLEKEIKDWCERLIMIQDILDNWLKVGVLFWNFYVVEHKARHFGGFRAKFPSFSLFFRCFASKKYCLSSH